MANLKNWTQEEEKYLTDHFGRIPAKQIADHLNRSVNSVYARAGKLNLKKIPAWPDEDITLLKKLFPKTDNKIIAERLGKTYFAVRSMAGLLKLKKSDNYWKAWQEKYVLDNYGRMPADEIAEELGRTRWAVINKYRELTGARKTGGKVIISKIK